MFSRFVLRHDSTPGELRLVDSTVLIQFCGLTVFVYAPPQRMPHTSQAVSLAIAIAVSSISVIAFVYVNISTASRPKVIDTVGLEELLSRGARNISR